MKTVYTHISPAVTPADDAFDIRHIEGRWFLHFTNFEFFHPHACLNVRFHFSQVSEDPVRFLDIVEFSKREEPSGFSIRGFDMADSKEPGSLTYFGTGPLESARIPWKVLGMGADHDWAVITGDMGMLGPELRIDILGRDEKMEHEQWEEITAFICARMPSCKIISTIFRVEQDWK